MASSSLKILYPDQTDILLSAILSIVSDPIGNLTQGTTGALTILNQAMKVAMSFREEPLMIWGGVARAKAVKKKLNGYSPRKKKLKKNSTAGWPGKKISPRSLCPSAPPDN